MTEIVPFREGCSRLGLPLSSAEKFIRNGTLPAPFRMGRKRFWRASDLREHIDRLAEKAVGR